MPNLSLVARLSTGWAGQMENDMKSKKRYKIAVAIPFVLFGVMLVMVLNRSDLLSWLLIIVMGVLALLGYFIYENLPAEVRTDGESL